MRLPNEHIKQAMMFNLLVLYEARKQLIEDFLAQNEEIYKSMFKYERRGQEMLRELSIEKYFVVWLVRHKEIKDNLLKTYQIDPGVQPLIEKIFNNLFLRFIQKIEDFHEELHQTDLMGGLVIRKIEVLKKFLQIGDKMNKEMESLIYNDVRDKALYERKIRQLEEGMR